MKHVCKECWEPDCNEGETVCKWCRMTDEERSKEQAKNWWLVALAVWLIIISIALGEYFSGKVS